MAAKIRNQQYELFNGYVIFGKEKIISMDDPVCVVVKNHFNGSVIIVVSMWGNG
jgi:hypothetical protein